MRRVVVAGVLISLLAGRVQVAVAASPDILYPYYQSFGAQNVTVTPDGTAVLGTNGSGGFAAAIASEPSVIETLDSLRGSSAQATSLAVGPESTTAYVGYVDAIVLLERSGTGAWHQREGAGGCLVAAPLTGCTTVPAIRGLTAVLIAPDGRTAYAAAADRIVVFDRDGGGGLTQSVDEACVGSLATPRSYGCVDGGHGFLPGSSGLRIAVRDGFLYGYSSSAVVAFARAASGALSRVPGGCVTRLVYTGCLDAYLPTAPRGLTISADGATMFVDGDGVAAFSLDAGGGVHPATGIGCASSDGDPRCLATPDWFHLPEVAVGRVGESLVRVDLAYAAGGALQRYTLTPTGLVVTVDTALCPTAYRACLPASFGDGTRTASGSAWVNGWEYAVGQGAPRCRTVIEGHRDFSVALAGQCRDPNGDPLTFVARDLGHASLADGVLTSAGDFAGSYPATVDVSDGFTTMTVSFTVIADDLPPTCDANSGGADFGVAPLPISIRCYDADDPDSSIVVAALPRPGHGQVTQASTSHGFVSLRYVPDDGFVGTDTFTATISDGARSTDSLVSVFVASKPAIELHPFAPYASTGWRWHGLPVLAIGYGSSAPIGLDQTDGRDYLRDEPWELRVAPIGPGAAAIEQATSIAAPTMFRSAVLTATILAGYRSDYSVAWSSVPTPSALVLVIADLQLVGQRRGGRVVVHPARLRAPARGRLVVERISGGQWVRMVQFANLAPGAAPKFSVAPDGARYRVTYLPSDPRAFQGSTLTFVAPRAGGFRTHSTALIGAAAMVATLPP